MRAEPNIELTHLGSGWLRGRIVSLHVPGVAAADQRYLLLVALQRRSSTATRRIIPLPARELFPGRSGVVIYRSVVTGHVKQRPIVVRTEALSECGIPAHAGILDGFQVAGAHHGGGGLQNRLGVLALPYILLVS